MPICLDSFPNIQLDAQFQNVDVILHSSLSLIHQFNLLIIPINHPPDHILMYHSAATLIKATIPFF